MGFYWPLTKDKKEPQKDQSWCHAEISFPCSLLLGFACNHVVSYHEKSAQCHERKCIFFDTVAIR